MTPDRQAALEQVAREWLMENDCTSPLLTLGQLQHNLASLLAAREVAVLEEVAKKGERFFVVSSLLEWCRIQAQERQP